MRYAHMVDATGIDPIWFDLAAVARYDFHPTLEDTCRAMECHLGIDPPVITHRLVETFR